MTKIFSRISALIVLGCIAKYFERGEESKKDQYKSMRMNPKKKISKMSLRMLKFKLKEKMKSEIVLLLVCENGKL